jgi:hypothetical protein
MTHFLLSSYRCEFVLDLRACHQACAKLDRVRMSYLFHFSLSAIDVTIYYSLLGIRNYGIPETWTVE